jgi:hypothetical protein
MTKRGKVDIALSLLPERVRKYNAIIKMKEAE